MLKEKEYFKSEIIKAFKIFPDSLIALGYVILFILECTISLSRILQEFFKQILYKSINILYQLFYKLNTKSVGKKALNASKYSIIGILIKISKIMIDAEKNIITVIIKTVSHIVKLITGRMVKLFKAINRSKSFFLGIFFALLFIIMPVRAYSWYQDLPGTYLLLEKGQRQTTKILDRKGRLLYEIFEDRKYDQVALELIPDHVVKSTLAVEDSEFFFHNGLRPLSIMRAAKATIIDDDMQGGSTITQQLIKNVLLTPERTIDRKLKEMALALMVEKKYTKPQILELYLNNIPYGGTSWGVQSASQKYFGKDVWDVDLAEAALLAGLPSAPTMYSPLNGNLEVAKIRQRVVLDRMVDLEYISTEDAEEAYAQELEFVPQIDHIRAPHFVAYVRNELEKIYGAPYVNYAGLTVVTTLDLEIQDQVQAIVSEEVEKSKMYNISNGAAVVLDPKTGEILAYVGSKNYFEENYGAYDVLTAYRQAGSAIKPVTYALAFQNGLTPATIIDDSPFTFKNEWETYTPVNYDNRFHGKVTLRQALANSYNIPAVRLVHRLGPDNMVGLGRDMGLRSWDVDGTYGISVTLGGKEVRPLDLTNVYATLARGGVHKEVTPFRSIKDPDENELYRGNNREKRVLGEGESFLVTNILSDYYARLPAFGINNYLSVPGHTIAVKTGTTDLKRDNYTMGYTPSYVVGVWVGNNDNAPMNRNLASGLTGAAPMWNRIMNVVLEGTPDERFTAPDNIIIKVDKECNNRTEYFIKGTNIPERLCEKDDDEDEDKDDKDKDKKKKKRD